MGVQWSATHAGPWTEIDYQTDGHAVWVMITISNATTVFFEVTSTRSQVHTSFHKSRFVHQDGQKLVLNNDLISVHVPAQLGATMIPPAPILTVDGRASAAWSGLQGACTSLLNFTARAAVDGPLFARVELRYAFVAGNLAVSLTIRKNHSEILVERL